MVENFLKFAYKFSEQDVLQGKIDGVAYSGDAIFDQYWGQIIFDLSSIESKDKVPVLMHHDPQQIVGFGHLEITDSLKIKGQLVSTNEADYVKKLSSEGFPWQMSVHIEPKEISEIFPDQKETINGREIIGPAVVFKNSLIREVSFTPTPVDVNTPASVFSFSKSIEKKIGEFKMACACENKDNKQFDAADTAKVQADLDAANAKIADLEAQLQAMKDEDVKEAKDAKMSALKTEFSVDGEELEALSSMSDKQIELYRKTFSAKKTETINPDLTKSDLKKDVQTFSVDKNDAESLRKGAKRLAAEQKISFEEAIKILIKQ